MGILGLDIGGANTKAAFFDGNEFKEIYVYLPIFSKKENLHNTLRELKNKFSPDLCSITMTAELCDCFKSKLDGIAYISKVCNNVFEKVKFFGFPGVFYDFSEVQAHYKDIGSFNWLALAQILSKKHGNALMIDIGSTTTDIISMIDHTPQYNGKSDFERLKFNELLYLGALRTNVSTVISSVNLDNEQISVAREYFANMADVYVVLEKIDENEYISDTSDGTTKSKSDCMRRIARILCSDLDQLSKKDIFSIANQIYEKNIAIIENSISYHIEKHKINFDLIGVGVGRFLAKEVAKRKKLSYDEDSEYYNQMACARAVASLCKS